MIQVCEEDLKPEKEKQKVTYRDINDATMYAFKNALKAFQWDELLYATNASEACQVLHEVLLEQYDVCFPIRVRVVGKSALGWYDTKLKEMRNTLDTKGNLERHKWRE